MRKTTSLNTNRMMVGGAAILMLLTDWTTTLGSIGCALMVLGVGMTALDELDAYLQRKG